MILKLNTVVPDITVFPERKRRIEHCDKDLPSPHIECRDITTSVPIPVAEPVPVQHGGACRCDEKAKEIILNLTSPQIAQMTPGEEFESSDLFERECWDSLSHAQQIEVGQCIVCLVAQGLLPLENLGASPKSANHVVYKKLPT